MPAAPKAAVLGKGQKSATTPTTSPAVSVSKPSPSSAGMSTPAQPPTPLSKNQKKKSKGAAATSPATANGSVLSTPAANIAKQQESSAKQQVTPAVESLGIKEDNTPAWVKEIEEEPSNKLEFDEESAPPETPRFAHTFRWMKGGNVVKVSGSFDNWNEQIELRKNPNNSDQSEIIIDVDHAINNYFKFIVDGQWKCSDEYPTEYDSAGNLNNVLYPLRN
ncbi:hypothetical protein FBU30_010637 [Linnemannia zychae]|nr:hypothetical protein FBU30_010637 [Linnemannia zychae]